MTIDVLLEIPRVPNQIKRLFKGRAAVSREQTLWREVAARVVLDAIGATGVTGEPDHHAELVRCARVWFKFAGEDQRIVFDLAGLAPDGVGEMLICVQPYNMGEVDKNGRERSTVLLSKSASKDAGRKRQGPRAKARGSSVSTSKRRRLDRA